MPTITYYRQWCKTCNDFELHFNRKCKACDTEYSDVYLKDIPEEKLTEQRKRYKESKRLGFKRIMEYSLSGFNTFSEPIKQIIESDAGQKRIDERINEKFEQAKLLREQQKEEAKKYKNVGRNDICPTCFENGLNIKFKKCVHFKELKHLL